MLGFCDPSLLTVSSHPSCLKMLPQSISAHLLCSPPVADPLDTPQACPHDLASMGAEASPPALLPNHQKHAPKQPLWKTPL